MRRGAYVGLLLLACCSSAPGIEVPPPSDDGTEPLDVPLRGSTAAQIARFRAGSALFEAPFREIDGLGPLFIGTACNGCHADAGKEAGLVQKMVVVDPDGRPSDDQARLPFGHTVRPQIAAGAKLPIVPPADPDVRTTNRVGPPVLGLGYVEAILDSEIERVAEGQGRRTDSIGGRVNRVVYASEANPDATFGAHSKGEVLIGRFGWKARIATLDDFAADALQGDMGLTSPMRPEELPNPDSLADDDKPGVDVDAAFINGIADYLRLIEIPARRGLTEQGRALFDKTQCSLCHVPSMRTRDDYPIAALCGIDAPIYSDLLVHDMGLALADGIADENANWREWRTPPLIGLRFMGTFLHDGRASSVEDAILKHAGSGSEAGGSARLFRALSEVERRELVRFVSAL